MSGLYIKIKIKIIELFMKFINKCVKEYKNYSKMIKELENEN